MTDDDEGVLSPDDLELPDEHVTELDDDRMVVHPDGDGPTDPAEEAVTEAAAGGELTDEGSAEEGQVDETATDQPLRDAVDVPEAYALAAAAKTERGLDQRVVRSNDVGRTFESFLRWYADRVAPDRDPEEVLRVLVAASELDASVETTR